MGLAWGKTGSRETEARARSLDFILGQKGAMVLERKLVPFVVSGDPSEHCQWWAGG
jgi:hypothetical protein